jgi:phospholipid transport system substrate-binding protein
MFLIASLKQPNRLMSVLRIYHHAVMVGVIAVAMLSMLASYSYASETETDRTQAAAEMVENLIFEIQDIAANVSNQDEIYLQADHIINRYFKYETLASFSIGPYWRKATDEQKQRFLSAFREVIVEQAANNFDYFRSLEYRFLSAEKKGENWIIINGMVHDTTGQYPDAVVSWRISDKTGQELYIFDLSFENVSMLLTQKDENMAVIRQNKGSLDALNDLLEKRSIELKQARLEN